MNIKIMHVGELGTNCYLLEDEHTHAAAVIDPGGDGARIEAQLLADGAELKLILLTHAHFDHTGGVAELHAAHPEVPVFLHPADAARLGSDVFPPIGAPTVPYGDGDVVKLGDLVIQVLHTPGHTPGGVCLLVGDALFTGDTLFPGGVGNTKMEGQSFELLYGDVVERLFGVYDDDTHFYPGHGADSTIGAERPHLDEWRERGW